LAALTQTSSRVIWCCAFFALLASAAAGCRRTEASDRNEPPKDLAARARALAEAKPRFGGTVVAVGEYSLELSVHTGGLIRAELRDMAGQPVHDSIQHFSVDPAPRGQAVELEYSGARQRFEARVAPGSLKAGDFEITIRSDHGMAGMTLSDVPVLPDPAP